MRLKYLWIEKFKNLKDFSIDFEKGNGLTMFIGTNGSGKSNILEAISAIFSGLQSPKNSPDFAFKLTYRTTGNDSVEKEIQINKYPANKTTCIVNGVTVTKKNIIQNKLFPSKVIAVYSGEDTRLYNTYYKPFYKQYINKLGRPYSEAPFQYMHYINKNYWDIALVCLIIKCLREGKLEIVNGLQIKEPNKITFEWGNTNNIKDGVLKAFIDRIKTEPQYTFVSFIHKLAEHTKNIKLHEETGTQYGQFTYENLQNLFYEEKQVFNFLMQAHIPNNEKIIKNIIIENGGVSCKHLSEGEKRLILVQAVLDIVADESTLILLDEPDSHIHESRKKEFLEIISGYTQYGRQIVFTTHSPTLVEISDESNIILLKNDEQGIVQQVTTEKLEIIRYLTGSRFNAFLERPILYCEGTETSLEGKLYPLLFPDYVVIPSGGHKEVINNTKMFNRTFNNKGNKAIGIIDWDYKSEEHLAALKTDNIFALQVLEVENILMDVEILKNAKEQFCADDTGIEKVIQNVLTECEKNLTKQATKHTSAFIISKINSSLKEENRMIEAFKTAVTEICKTENIDEVYSQRLENLNCIIKSKDYKSLQTIYDFNHELDRFLKDCIVNDYRQKILRLISKTKNLQDFIKQKYFKDIPDTK